jgi:hypothetical protein
MLHFRKIMAISSSYGYVALLNSERLVWMGASGRKRRKRIPKNIESITTGHAICLERNQATLSSNQKVFFVVYY